jgi:hypothetical protein
MELVGEMTKKAAAGGSEDDVVHVEQEISHLMTLAKNKQRDIAFGSNEPDAMHIVGEALVPSPRGLLEAVEGLVKPTNMLGMSVVDEAGRLLAGILDVELVHRPGARDRDAEDGADHGGLDHVTEHRLLVKVNSKLLREPMDYPASLVPGKAAIRGELALENPLP